jgi:hypothetical protein
MTTNDELYRCWKPIARRCADDQLMLFKCLNGWPGVLPMPRRHVKAADLTRCKWLLSQAT